MAVLGKACRLSGSLLYGSVTGGRSEKQNGDS